jgi:hypothetical protein
LALAARERADRLARVAHVDADLAHLVLGDPVGLADVEAAEGALAPAGLAAHEEVAGDAHQGNHRQVLVDRGDAAIERVARAGHHDRLAVDQDLALGRLMHARERLDQRRFAGAVVAEQAHHLARVHLHRDAVERDHRAEALDDLPQLHQRRRAAIAPVCHRRSPLVRLR